jgi:hypothetical protein
VVRLGGAIALMAMATILSACTFEHIDAHGERHIAGLFDITIRAPKNPETIAGDVIEITSIGISAGETAQGGYLTIGFNHETTASLRDNALVIGNPVTAIRKP